MFWQLWQSRPFRCMITKCHKMPSSQTKRKKTSLRPQDALPLEALTACILHLTPIVSMITVAVADIHAHWFLWCCRSPTFAFSFCHVISCQINIMFSVHACLISCSPVLSVCSGSSTTNVALVNIWANMASLAQIKTPFSRGSNGNTTTSSNICKPQDTYRYFGHKYIEIIKVPVIIKVSLYNIILLKKIRKCRECARVKLTNNNHTLTVCSVQVPMSLTHWHTPTHPYKAKGLFG